MPQRSDELEHELDSLCKNHVRGLATGTCLYCGEPLPPWAPTCASPARELELAFERYARAASALLKQ
jgi:hypothetical protein